MKEAPSVKQTVSATKATTTLRVHFPEVTVAEAACDVTVAASGPTPTLSVSASALEKPSPGSRYIVFSLDLDAPFPSWPFLSPILHGIQANLTAGAIEADGFVALEGSAAWEVMPYVGPGPPKLSGPHRYVFLLFEQPEGMDAAAVKVALGLEGRGTGIPTRVRWDQEAAEKKLGLSRLVAGNYFSAQS